MGHIVGIGACVMDTLISLPAFPQEDTKLRASNVRPAGGGPVGTGLVAASKLGADCAYIGTLSDDTGGVFLLEDFQKYGVDTRHITLFSGYRSFTSCIWLNEANGSRTCVFDKGTLPPLVLSEDQRQAVADADILMVDGNELDAAVEAAIHARKNGTLVLYDAGGRYPNVERLLMHTDLLIPSEEFALSHTGAETAEQAAKILFNTYHPKVVVITQGSRGGVYYDGTMLSPYPAYPTHVVDSNGAGDVFHGAFAAAVSLGYDYLTCCYFASATSSIKCQGVGARESAPDLQTVKAFLAEHHIKL